MNEKKKNMGRQNDTGKLKRRNQVASKLTLEHILWQCKETEEERRKGDMTKKSMGERKEEAKHHICKTSD
jgi:hypothetical protein